MSTKKASAKQAAPANPGSGDVIRSVRFPKPLLKRMKQLALDQETNVQAVILDAVERFLTAEKY